MLRFELSRLSVHPVEPRAAGLLPPAVRPRGRRLSVVLTLALTRPQKPFRDGPRREWLRKTIDWRANAVGERLPVGILNRSGGGHGREQNEPERPPRDSPSRPRAAGLGRHIPRLFRAGNSKLKHFQALARTYLRHDPRRGRREDQRGIGDEI